MFGLRLMQAATAPILTGLLKEVSRSFYLTLRILPSPVRPQISLAYLLARATDTIADTELVPVTTRLEALSSLSDRILGISSAPLPLQAWLETSPHRSMAHAGTGNAAEFILLQRLEEILQALTEFSGADQSSIRNVLQTITSGQVLDLQRFGAAQATSPVALADEKELDDYTYRVAGCVGEFWTELCQRHLFPNAPLSEAEFLELGIRFGKGLQLVNILRDIPADLRKGRCYLPQTQLTALGLSPASLVNPASEPRLRPLYDSWLDQAEAHLNAGWRYTCLIPGHYRKLRLACAWPLLIGIRTVARLRVEPVLDPAHRVKTTRAEIRSILLRSILLLPFPNRWRRQFPATAAPA